MLYNVQVLRAIASMLVVHAHSSGPSGLSLAWFGGANGVDLFFVISGFIISYVASLDADQFMTRRVIRIVPIYWASSTAVFLLALAMPRMFHTVSSDPALFVRSLFFLPDASSMHKDGILHPTLGGGWTLNYEMYFYVVYWIALAISRKWAGLVATSIIGSIIVVVQGTGLHSNAIAGFYGSPIVLEFLYGIVIFHLLRYAEARGLRERLAGLQKLGLSACAIAALICLAFEKQILGHGPRCIVSGVPAFLIVLCAVFLERMHAMRITNKVLIAVGDASYVLYLLHAYIVFGLVRVVIGQHTFSEPTGQLIVVGFIVISAAASIAVYEYFEKPILKRLKTLLLRPRPARARPA